MDTTLTTSFMLEHIFPNGKFDAERFDALANNGRFRRQEINNLPANTYPVCCNVLLSGLEKNSRNDRREHMLIEAFGNYIHLRICTAMEESGYKEFALINAIVPVDSEAGIELKDYATGSIMSICNVITVNNVIVPADNTPSL